MFRAMPVALGATMLVAAACAPVERERAPRAPEVVVGEEFVVRDSMVAATVEASGVAEPIQKSTLATKLMGTVVEVLVREGDAVRTGQVVARIDARDLAAKEAQVSASVAEAEAVRRDAETQAARIRALYADSAATRVQLDAVETGLARADAGVRAARAASEELGAVRAYAEVRAPFAGTVTQRFVDPGAFAAPGTPIVTVEDASRIRVRASTAPTLIRALRRGDRVSVTIEGATASAIVEGVVPAAGNLYTVNAVVDNREHRFLAGSAAALQLTSGSHAARLIPIAAVRRQGDLTGVSLRLGDATTGTIETRWIRLGRTRGTLVEVDAGLVAGDRVIVPATASGAPPASAPTASARAQED